MLAIDFSSEEAAAMPADPPPITTIDFLLGEDMEDRLETCKGLCLELGLSGMVKRGENRECGI